MCSKSRTVGGKSGGGSFEIEIDDDSGYAYSPARGKSGGGSFEGGH